MKLILLISKHCDACFRAIEQLQNLQKDFPGITTEIININDYKDKRIFITPALIINGKLFSYGDIDKEKLLAKLNEV